MAEHRIAILNRIAVADAGIELVCNNPTDTIRFEFDEEWNGIVAKTARFTWDGNKIDVPFTENTVEVPEIFRANYVYVGVYADNIASTPAKVKCRYSIKCLGGKNPPPSEDVYNRILKLINELQRGGVTDEQIEEAIEKYLAEHPIEGDGAVASVNGKTGAVMLSAADVGALPADTPIPIVPKNVSAFTNDAGYAKKTEIPNVSDFITRAVDDLANYYTKSQTYSQEEIDQKVSAIPKFAIAVVSALPSTGISATTIYLVPGGADNNLYTEYIYVNGTWEILGSQRVDLTGYATQTWMLEQLKGYQPKGNYLTEHQDISGKLDANKLPEAIDDALAQAKESGEFDGADGGYYEPNVDAAGNLTWAGSKEGMFNITGQNIKGPKGDPGTSITVTGITQSTEDGGNNEVAFSDGNTLTVKNGKNGNNGVRGTSILRITTAPTAYTTATGGFTPDYRIALSTVKSQAGVNEVLIGDTVLRNYYTYPVGYVDANYVYLGKYASIRGTAGTSITIASVTESEESGGENVVTFSDDTILTVKNGKDGVGGVAVPDYWESELAQKAEAIQLAMEAAGRNKSAFLWYTDAHWPDGNSKVSPVLLNHLIRNTPMNKVNFGGDIVGSTLLDRSQMGYLYEWREMIADLPNHHSVSGNHDKFSNYSYAFLIAPEESPEMVFGNGAYYYIDNPAEKTRYIYVEYFETSTANADALLEQGKFIVDAIKGVSEGWHIVAIAHRWFQYASSSTPTTGGFSAFEGDMLEVFDAYNARTTRNGSSWFYAQDFKDAKGKVEFCIGGHIHVDHDLYSAGGIPVILTASDANQERSGDETEDAGTIGTITEAAVFGIVADYSDAESTKITVVGVGRGTSRVIGEAAPVNLFDKDDPDLLDTGRFNSSNNAVAYAAGQVVTGFIEAKVGDTFTVSTDKSLNTSVYTCDMMTYRADKTAIDNINAAMTAWTVGDDGLTGTITIPANYQFNVDNIVSYEGTTYVRFCVAYTNMDNIVITKS